MSKSARQQAKDDRLERAVSAYLLEGAYTRAAKSTGIPRQTLERLVTSAEGQALMEKLRTKAGPDLASRCLSIAEKYFSELDRRISDPTDAKGIPARDLAVIGGILVDKSRAVQAPVGAGDGTWEVTVTRGGARVATDGVEGTGTVMEAASMSVSVKGPARP